MEHFHLTPTSSSSLCMPCPARTNETWQGAPLDGMGFVGNDGPKLERVISCFSDLFGSSQGARFLPNGRKCLKPVVNMGTRQGLQGVSMCCRYRAYACEAVHGVKFLWLKTVHGKLFYGVTNRCAYTILGVKRCTHTAFCHVTVCMHCFTAQNGVRTPFSLRNAIPCFKETQRQWAGKLHEVNNRVSP